MRIKRLIALSGMAALLWSCAKEPVFEPVTQDSGLIPLNIDGSINQVSTKATASGFVDKDAVGLFAVNYLDNNTTSGTLLSEGNQVDNIKYIFDEPNYKWNPVRPAYYKNVNTNVDLYVYYPYQAEITNVNEANFEVKKDQSAAATAIALSGYEASDWEDAVRYAGHLLYVCDAVEERYIEAMVENIKEHGPYIVIWPGTALPHADTLEGVKREAASLVRLKTPVEFYNEMNDPVRYIIAVSILSAESINQALYDVMAIFGNEKTKAELDMIDDEKKLLEKIKTLRTI